MKIKCKLVKTQEIKTMKDFKVMFTYIPTLEEWQKKIKLTVTTPDPAEDTDKLGIPIILDDVIILEMTTKEEQTTLDKPEKKEKE